jgi:hypothetical protein
VRSRCATACHYAKSLVAATPADQLIEGRPRRQRGLSEEQIAIMQRESENLDRELRLIEQSYGADHLDLVLATGYVGRLCGTLRSTTRTFWRNFRRSPIFRKQRKLRGLSRTGSAAFWERAASEPSDQQRSIRSTSTRSWPDRLPMIRTWHPRRSKGTR